MLVRGLDRRGLGVGVRPPLPAVHVEVRPVRAERDHENAGEARDEVKRVQEVARDGGNDQRDGNRQETHDQRRVEREFLAFEVRHVV